MNIVILCKNHNHRKVLDIAYALAEFNLPIRGFIALDTRNQPRTARYIVRRLYEEYLKMVRGRGIAALRRGRPPSVPHQLSMAAKPPRTPNGQDSRSRANLTIQGYALRHHIAYEEVKDLNSPQTAEMLRKLAPDLVLLGGVPIIRPHILAIPLRGTLNVHMGLLPAFRGKNVAEWSVFTGQQVGITVHFVDPGVDTGNILYREPIEVDDCADIAAMRAKIRKIQHRALAKCAMLLLANQLQPLPQEAAAGKQYYVMHPRLRAIVERRLAQGYRPTGRRSSPAAAPAQAPQPAS